MRSFLCLAIIGLFVPVAAQVRELTPQQLCRNADRVLTGGVNKLQPRWDGQKIVTDVTIVPVRNLKGDGATPFVITIPGGTMGGITLRASEAPRFAVGEQVVLFLKPGAGPCDVYGWYRGKYTVVDGKVRELVDTTVETFTAQLEQIIRNR